MKVVQDLVPTIDELPTRQRVAFPEIRDELFWRFYEEAKAYSMIHVTGFYNVYQSFSYIAANGIKGDVVECGCFLGGMALFMGRLRDHFGLSGTKIILFDTFKGPPIGSTDIVGGQEKTFNRVFPNYRASVEETLSSRWPGLDGFQLIEGLVQDTIPSSSLRQLALLRLGTDYYESTKLELDYLYPKLVPGGVIIVDDYGYFDGARRATDEYLAMLKSPPLLNRIDIGVWAGVKPTDNRDPDASGPLSRVWRRAAALFHKAE